ncbi:transglutaminase family protein [Solimonas sp. K1W22B-7]|uniref:transglutaminase family protein n=1 Tax=Solimonas sp. K1W22B-7 TaxID=2303331 RepID=UPI000E32F870|nr:transglutaminase family protein [Solimonas sp. K1W22B-7]AXQ28641.1 transglutaminase family protein [Solimonas sp. K1W22B-7]
MAILSVEHRTLYRYARPVSFNDHRLMCRPRDSHDLRLLETGLSITPAATVRWMHDVFGNSIAIASFAEPATELCFTSSFLAEHFPAVPQDILIEEYARKLPFSYPAEEVADLGRTKERHYPDPEHRIDAWAKRFVGRKTGSGTLNTLVAMTRAIRKDFQYARREEMGVQTPVETLLAASGSCRDFALLLMEAARSLGLAARFVSGYLYDEKLLDAGDGLVGGGATHAWAEIFLPGAGWIEFDPTNALIGGRNLIRVAVARDASQAVPLSGSYTGAPEDYQGMTVEVTVASGRQPAANG